MSTSDGVRTPEAIEVDIARQRDELAHTVSQLQAKLDVKTRAKDELAHLKDRATTSTGKPRPDLTIAVALGVAALVGLVVWRRTR
jgi:hypothetical protein